MIIGYLLTLHSTRTTTQPIVVSFLMVLATLTLQFCCGRLSVKFLVRRVMERYMNRESPAAMAAWAEKVGIAPQEEPWSVGFSITTVPIENWFYKRNALRPEDIMLDLTVPSHGLWCADLYRHDKLFRIQWRPNGDLRAESQQMKYKKLIKWPHLGSLDAFPHLIAQIEETLSIKFIRHVNVGTNGWVNLESWVAESGKEILDWLSPCADTIGTYLKST